MSSVSIPGSRGLQRWCVWRKWCGGNVWDSFAQNVDLVVRWEGLRDVRAAVCRGGNVVGRQTSLLVLHFLMEKDQYCLVGWSGVGYEGQVEVPLVVHHVVDPGAQVEKAAPEKSSLINWFFWAVLITVVRYQNNNDIICNLDEFLWTTLTGLVLLPDYCSVGK